MAKATSGPAQGLLLPLLRRNMLRIGAAKSLKLG
jgi:hypothetical protein